MGHLQQLKTKNILIHFSKGGLSMKKIAILLTFLVFSMPLNLFSQESKNVKDQKELAQVQETKDAKIDMPVRDIEDIPVPSLMKLDKGNTFLFEAKGIKVGILKYKGNVDSFSLAEAIKNNLIGEKWRLVNTLTYRNTINMNFVKNDRTCNVFIEEGFFSTHLEIRVGVISGN
jgi:hypothetical protein